MQKFFYRCRKRSLFPWDIPSDWDFVECLLGTFYRWNEVYCGIQSSSWAGPLYPAPLSPYLYFSPPSPQIFGLTSYFLPCSFSSKHDNILVQGCSHLKPLYLSISLVCWSLLKCHLLGKALFFLLLCLIYCQSFSAKCKLHEGLDLCCVALYPLYLQQCLTHRSGSKHVHWVNG